MSQSLVNNLVHLIYSTKHREPLIPEEFFDGLYAYQAGIFKQWESPAVIIGGIEDHVHALFSLSKNHALKKIVEEVKKGRPVSPFQGYSFAISSYPGRRQCSQSSHGLAPGFHVWAPSGHLFHRSAV